MNLFYNWEIKFCDLSLILWEQVSYVYNFFCLMFIKKLDNNWS